jgi:hypothetical protein
VKNFSSKYDCQHISVILSIAYVDLNMCCAAVTLKFEKYSIFLIAARIQVQIHIIQPQREGDGRQALVVPPLDPTPATSLSRTTSVQFLYFSLERKPAVCDRLYSRDGADRAGQFLNFS